MDKKVSNYLREAPKEWKVVCRLIRKTCLEKQFGLEEEWKWGPNYSNNGLVVGWAYFKKHIKITFFNGVAISKNQAHFNHCLDNVFNRSIKIDPENPFDEKVFRLCLEESIAVNKRGFKRIGGRKELEMHEGITQMLSKNKKLKNSFEALAPSHKREYIEWITETKRETTRERRLEKMRKMLLEGKDLHSQYR